MLFIDFVRWWYGPGWVLRFRMLVSHVENWLDYFSVRILLKTLFSPWRQTITYTIRDESIDKKFSAFLDNLISRLVGFFVRIFALIAAVVMVLVIFILNIIYVCIWPLLPLAFPIIAVVGVVI
jgi:hypothetical protein